MNGLRIALIVAVFAVVGDLGIQLGITSEFIQRPVQPLDPSHGIAGGILNTLTNILAPLTWVFNALGSFFQILTFQADVPTLVTTFVLVPMSFFMMYTLVRLIRGGG